MSTKSTAGKESDTASRVLRRPASEIWSRTGRTLRLLVQGGEGFEAGQTPVGLVVALPEEQRRIGVGGECSAGHRRGTGVNLTDVDGGEHVVFLLVIGCRHRAWDLRRSVRNLPIRGVIAIGNVRVRSHR